MNLTINPTPVSDNPDPVIINENVDDETQPVLPPIEDQSNVLSKEEAATRKGSFFSGVVNLSNTILGSGLLALPSAFAQCGYILGSLMLILAGLGSCFGLHLTTKCAHKVGGFRTSFHAIAELSYPRVAFLADFAVAIKCFGVATSYLVVIGDLLPQVVVSIVGPKLEGSFAMLYSREFWISFILLTFIVPLCCLKHLYALRHMSLFSLVSVAYLVVLIVLFQVIPSLGKCQRDGVEIPNCIGRIQPVVPRLCIFTSLPVFIFSFTCHQNLCTIYNERAVPFKDRETSITKVVQASIGLATFLYLIVANFGYFTYGDHVTSNVLKHYPYESYLVVAGRCMIVFNVTTSYPLQCHPARLSIMQIFVGIGGSKWEQEPRRLILFTAITVLHILGTYLIALFVTDLGVVFGVIGATGSTIICYLLPGLFFWKMFEKDPTQKVKRVLAAVMVVFGMAIMSISLSILFLPRHYLCAILQKGSNKWDSTGCGIHDEL